MVDGQQQGGEFQLTAARRRLGLDARDDALCAGFNSQPREGGWMDLALEQAAEQVSTHSRAKAAGFAPFQNSKMPLVSTHSRAKAAGGGLAGAGRAGNVSTHSRAKAAGCL